MSAAAPVALPALDNTMGATLIGVIIGAALWGVSAMQVWYYFTNYPEDKWFYKWLVAGVFFSDTMHQILISHTIYTYLVTNFGNYVELGNLVWSIMLEVLFNGLTAILVQSFMIARIFMLAPRKWRWPACSLVTALVLADFVGDVVYYARGFHIKTYAELTILKANTAAINGLAAAADILIALIMCTVLQRSRTGFKNSDTMINSLILFTMNTGLLTSMCALAALLSLELAPNTFIYIAFFFNVGRLYTNSLLATLNARQAIRAGLNQTQTVSLSKLKNHNVDSNHQVVSGTTLDIKVSTTRQKHSDDASDAENFDSKATAFPYEDV
ncbi:hypothetical protein FIBSPDRAFT_1038163 [Athelia psychrophila]|uniref:DUF6534 domain-containing protein n=1 Tax=Athelia psychrophila TaxID=1759441 RepID=A0A166TD98_9AGAM|nr:hypothetical protein FIBSPDRAFT_1038163 [Fibularhizoctonia sp. CBS 109695]